MRSRGVVCLFLTAGSLLPLLRLHSQEASPTGRKTGMPQPRWMTAWSPFTTIAEKTRQLPQTGGPRSVLAAPARRVGMLWSAGVPAALAFDVHDARAELSARYSDDDGAYRRPLDPEVVRTRAFSAVGWQPLGGGGGDARAVIGRVTVREDEFKDGSPSNLIFPYSDDPFVVTDTTIPEIRLIDVRLEGAMGWRFGNWGLGIATGVNIIDTRTRNARFFRSTRSARPAASASVLRKLPVTDIYGAVYARWIGGNETVLDNAMPGQSTVFLLNGYSDPDPIQLQPPVGAFSRRIERRARAFGGSFTGTLERATWVVFGERTFRYARHFTRQGRPDPPTDRYDSDGWRTGGELQRPLGKHLLLTVSVRYSRLSGEARSADLDAVIFRTSENRAAAEMDVLYRPAGDLWVVRGTFTLSRDKRAGRDFIARVPSKIVAWDAGGTVTVSRRFGSLAASLGYAITGYSPVSTIPNPGSLGPVYQSLVAGDLAIAATRARPMAAIFELRQRLSARTSLLLTTRWESLKPRGRITAIPEAPTGKRTLWTIGTKIVLRP